MNMRKGYDQPAAAIERNEPMRVVTDVVTVKVTARETGDAVTVVEVETPPGGGIPPHTQRYETESIYVLEGTYAFFREGAEETLVAGDARFIGRGEQHGFANAGPTRARMLVHLMPGSIHEQFLNEIGDLATRSMWESDLGRIVAVAGGYGIEFMHSDPASENR